VRLDSLRLLQSFEDVIECPVREGCNQSSKTLLAEVFDEANDELSFASSRHSFDKAELLRGDCHSEGPRLVLVQMLSIFRHRLYVFLAFALRSALRRSILNLCLLAISYCQILDKVIAFDDIESSFPERWEKGVLKCLELSGSLQTLLDEVVQSFSIAAYL
jgi:hypothetical protein